MKSQYEISLPYRQGGCFPCGRSHDRFPGRAEAAPIYMYYAQVVLRGYCSVKGGGNCRSINITISEAILRSWLWSTATGSCLLGNFGNITVSG